MLISEVAKLANMSKDGIRHYEEMGLITSTPRAAGGRVYREYDLSVIDQIDKAFAAGPTDAIVMMIGANDRRGIYATDGKLAAAYKSPQWPAAYRARVDKFMDSATTHLVPLVTDAVRAVDIDARMIDVDLQFLGED